VLEFEQVSVAPLACAEHVSSFLSMKPFWMRTYTDLEPIQTYIDVGFFFPEEGRCMGISPEIYLNGNSLPF